MKNKLAENMLRFGPKNLTESSRSKLFRLAEQTEKKDYVQAIAGAYVDSYQSADLNDKISVQYAAYAKHVQGYAVFEVAKSILGSNGNQTIVLGNTGVISYSDDQQTNWKYQPADVKIGKLKNGITDQVLADAPGFDREVSKSMDNISKFNPESPRVLGGILSYFVTGKSNNYNFNWSDVGGYNESKHGAVTAAAANFINLAIENGLVQADPTSKELLAKLS